MKYYMFRKLKILIWNCAIVPQINFSVDKSIIGIYEPSIPL